MAIGLLSIGGNLELRALAADRSLGGTFAWKFGARTIPALDVALSLGTGSGQVNWVYYASRTLAATTGETFDLRGSLTDAFGSTINATFLKLAVVAISDPNGTKELRVGPRGVTNAVLAGFGDASDYQTVRDWWIQHDGVTGYAVTAGTADLFPVYNPSAGSVTYSILLAGVQ